MCAATFTCYINSIHAASPYSYIQIYIQYSKHPSPDLTTSPAHAATAAAATAAASANNGARRQTTGSHSTPPPYSFGLVGICG